MIKMADTCKPLGQFPVAEAEDIDFADGESLQKKLDDGSLGGGSGSWNGTREDFEKLDKNLLKDGQQLNFTDDYNKNVIDDSKTSGVSTWSSQKISDELGEIESDLGEISNSLKIERKTIYANANNVGDTTISNVDFDGLLFIVVLVNFGNVSGEFYSSFVTIPITTNGSIVLSANNIAGITRTRAFGMYVEEGTIKFGNGYQGSTANNSYCLPRAIYGYYQK